MKNEATDGYSALYLGDEDDDALIERLKDTLRRLRFRQVDSERFLVGSQDYSGITCERDGETVVVEAETYMGLSISGKKNIVDEIISVMK